MDIKYFGHSAFQIDDLLIDPFISGNQKSTDDPGKIQCNLICITHDHRDHIGDAFSIAKRTGAKIVAISEVAEKAIAGGITVEKMGIGGTIRTGDWEIKMTPAMHSSYSGAPAGFILKKAGTTIYHAGDTALFGDMKLIGDRGIDIAMLPIGDRFTMGVEDALTAIELIRPKIVLPMHYETFPTLTGDPKELQRRSPVRVDILRIGEQKTYSITGTMERLDVPEPPKHLADPTTLKQ